MDEDDFPVLDGEKRPGYDFPQDSSIYNKLRRTEEMNVELNSSHNEIVHELLDTQVKVRTLEAENQSLKESLKKSSQQESTIKKKYDEIQAEVEYVRTSQKDSNESDAKYSFLRNKVEQKEDEVREYRLDVEALERENTILAQEINSLRSGEQELQVQKLEEENSRLKMSLRERDQMDLFESNTFILNATSQVLASMRESSVVSGTEEIIDKIKEENESLRSEVERLRSDAVELRKCAETNAEKMKRWDSRIFGWTDRLQEDYMATYNARQKVLSDIEKERVLLVKKNELLADENRKRLKTIFSLRNELEMASRIEEQSTRHGLEQLEIVESKLSKSILEGNKTKESLNHFARVILGIRDVLRMENNGEVENQSRSSSRFGFFASLNLNKYVGKESLIIEAGEAFEDVLKNSIVEPIKELQGRVERTRTEVDLLRSMNKMLDEGKRIDDMNIAAKNKGEEMSRIIASREEAYGRMLAEEKLKHRQSVEDVSKSFDEKKTSMQREILRLKEIEMEKNELAEEYRTVRQERDALFIQKSEWKKRSEDIIIVHEKRAEESMSELLEYQADEFETSLGFIRAQLIEVQGASEREEKLQKQIVRLEDEIEDAKEDLERERSDIASTLAELEKTKRELERDLQESHHNLGSKERALMKVENDLQRRDIECKTLRDTIVSLRARISSLEGTLDKERMKWDEEKENLLVKVSNTELNGQTQIEKWRNAYLTSESKRETQLKKHEELMKEREKVESELFEKLSSALSTMEKVKEDKDKAELRHKELIENERRRQDVSRKTFLSGQDELKTTISEKLEEISESQMRISELQDELTSVRSDLSSRVQQLKDVEENNRKSMQEMEKSFDDRTKEVQREVDNVRELWKADTSRFQKQILTLNEQAANKRIAADKEVSETRDDMRKIEDEWRKKLLDKDAEVDDERKKCGVLEDEILGLKEKLQNTSTEEKQKLERTQLVLEEKRSAYETCMRDRDYAVTEKVKLEHELEEKCIELESYRQRLESESDHHSASMEKLRAEKLEAIAKNCSLEGEIADLKRKNEGEHITMREEFESNEAVLKGEKERRENEVNELKAKLAFEKKRWLEKVDSSDGDARTLSEAQQLLDDARDESTRCKAEKESLSNELQQVRKEKIERDSKLRNELSSSRASTEKYIREKEEMRRRHSEQENTWKSSTEEIRQKHLRELERMNDKCQSLEERNTMLNERLVELQEMTRNSTNQNRETELYSLKQENMKLEEQLLKVTANLKSAEKNKDELRKNYEKEINELKESQEVHIDPTQVEEQSSSASLQREVENSRVEVNELKRERDELLEANKALKKDASQRNHRLANLKKQIESANGKINSQGKTNDELEKKLNVLEAKCDILEKKLNSAYTENQKLRDITSNANISPVEEEQKEDKSEEIESLRNELKVWKENCEEAEKGTEEMLSQNRAMRRSHESKIAELREIHNDELESRIEQELSEERTKLLVESGEKELKWREERRKLKDRIKELSQREEKVVTVESKSNDNKEDDSLLRNELEEVSEELLEAKNTIQALREQEFSLKREIDDLRKSNDSLILENSKLTMLTNQKLGKELTSNDLLAAVDDLNKKRKERQRRSTQFGHRSPEEIGVPRHRHRSSTVARSSYLKHAKK